MIVRTALNAQSGSLNGKLSHDSVSIKHSTPHGYHKLCSNWQLRPNLTTIYDQDRHDADRVELTRDLCSRNRAVAMHTCVRERTQYGYDVSNNSILVLVARFSYTSSSSFKLYKSRLTAPALHGCYTFLHIPLQLTTYRLLLMLWLKGPWSLLLLDSRRDVCHKRSRPLGMNQLNV